MSILILAASALVISADFPEPEGLEPNVRFWQRVYAEWSSAEVAFHDREHMGVVYGLLELGELRLFPRPEDPTERRARVKARRELIEERRDRIVSGLKTLAELGSAGELDPAALEETRPELAALYRAIEQGGALEHICGAADRLRWQYGLSDRFYEGLVRYDRYRDVVVEPFIERGLPEDLLALAFVESLFDPAAVSHAGAAGMFQFMPATGREYGLSRGPLWDLRRDPVLAADAAARMLRRNHQRLGNWPLALTGYNHGPNGVARGVRQVGSNDLMDLIESYSSPSWGFASRNFYAQFLAARRTLESRYEVFGEWVAAQPLKMAEVRLSSPVRLSSLVSRGCLPREVLGELNPALLEPAYAARAPLPTGFVLRLPPGSAGTFGPCARAAAAGERPDPTVLAVTRDYTVAAGDTLTAIAARYGVSVAELMELNGLSADGFIRIGQVLRIPGRGPGPRGAGSVGAARPEY